MTSVDGPVTPQDLSRDSAGRISVGQNRLFCAESQQELRRWDRGIGENRVDHFGCWGESENS